MADLVEELIREIAAKHGIAVSRDDPILVLQTINNRLMQDSARAQQVQLNLYKEELEALALRWGNDARKTAERTLNAALAASKDAMWRSMQEGPRHQPLACGRKSTPPWPGWPLRFVTHGGLACSTWWRRASRCWLQRSPSGRHCDENPN